jgi:hypothetical protein
VPYVPRFYGFVAVACLAAAVALVLVSHGWRPTDVLGGPVPGPTPPTTACAGLRLTGGHQGCFTFSQIHCRPRSSVIAGDPRGPQDLITADGVLGGATPGTVSIRSDQTVLALVTGGDTVKLLGPGPQSFDLLWGAYLDLSVGQVGSPDLTKLVGQVTCSGT